MHFKNVPALLLLLYILLFSGCSAIEKSDIQQFASTAIGRFSTVFDDISESFSVRSLEKSNQTLLEPEYVTWQTARHYYAELTEKEQLAYRCIYNAVFGQPERISVPMLETEELNAVFTALRYDNPQLLFLDDDATLLTAGMYCYFVPNYTLPYWQARETIVQAAEKAKELLKRPSVNNGDYETLLWAHDALCALCSYGDAGQSSQCSGALLQQTATCAGYAKALKLMLDIAGIDSCTVTGTVADEGGLTVSHMWLAVCIDGMWSFCDPTWDDPVSEDGRQTVEHGYFSLSLQRLSLTHFNIEMPSYIVCSSEEHDYYVYQNLFCTGENYMSVVAHGIESALQNGADFSEYRFDSKEALQQANKVLFEEENVYDLLADAAYIRDDLQTNRIGFSVDENRLQLKLIFSFEE